MRRNGYLGTSFQKSDPAIRPGELDFLKDRCISTTEWRLLDIFDVFMLLRRMALWPLTFWLWECFVYSASHVRPTYQFLLSCVYQLLSYEYWLSDHISVIWNSHCACAVSRDFKPGAKIVHIFEIPDPNLPIHFVTFRALRRRLGHVMGKNSVYPIMKATKFTAHAQYHVTSTWEVPQNHT